MNTTIFYENSFGIMCQWRGQIIGKTESSIDIRFSKNKALRFNLKNTDCRFLLVTDKPVKNILNDSEMISFCDETVNEVLMATEGNVRMFWNGKWQA